jgi:hypothetical protein
MCPELGPAARLRCRENGPGSLARRQSDTKLPRPTEVKAGMSLSKSAGCSGTLTISLTPVADLTRQLRSSVLLNRLNHRRAATASCLPVHEQGYGGRPDGTQASQETSPPERPGNQCAEGTVSPS